MPPGLSSNPATVCILRLSAIGDACHVLAVVRALQQAWPDTAFTWVIGKVEAKLMGQVPGIEFIVVDKTAGTLHARRQLAATLRGRSFDVLLHMQLSFRASVLSTAIKAGTRVGFDRARAREAQWLFTNQRIVPAHNQHVLDGLLGFAAHFGIQAHPPRWDFPLSQAALDYAAELIPEPGRTLLISPCSSHKLRNWRAEHYAAVADYAVAQLGMEVILCGGPSDIERRTGEEILGRMRQPCRNVIGRDTLPQLQATLARASALLTPDSGPAHMATMAGTPVIGLYAATNPERSGPYFSRQWCVDRYDAAAQRFLGKSASQIPWTTKIEHPGVMDLITVEDVRERLQALRSQQTG